MTPTTPTPALADLDLDKLEALANAATTGEWLAERGMVSAAHPRSNDADGTTILATFTGYFDEQHANAEFCATFNPDTAKKLIALARRAAQPVAPVAWLDLEKLKAGMAYATAFQMNDKQTALGLATPSPQIAEVAELPPLPEMLGAADMGAVLDTPEDWDADYRATWRNLQIAECNKRQWRAYALQLRDAIAASRRAAGGEPIYQVRRKPMNGATFDWRDVSEERYRTQYVEDEWNEKRVVYATPAPASAGQADGEPYRVETEDRIDIWKGKRRIATINDKPFPSCAAERKEAEKIVAALNGAGQAEASQAGRQYQRKVDEKIIARRDAEIASLRAGQAGQVPTCTCPSGDGSLRWPCPQHPPERAAAPAELDLVACKHCGGGGFYVHKGDDVACRVCDGKGATHQPSAQVKP